MALYQNEVRKKRVKIAALALPHALCRMHLCVQECSLKRSFATQSCRTSVHGETYTCFFINAPEILDLLGKKES